MAGTRGPERTPGGVGAARVVVAAVLASLGVVLLAVGLARPPASAPAAVAPAPVTAPPTSAATTPTAAPSPAPTRTPRTDVRDRVSDLVLPESPPVTVSIPGLDVRSRLVDLGLDQRGEMEVPQEAALAGWFDRGAAPGALGPAVIAGHVTWDGAPAVFHRLGSLRRGDRVEVTREDGRTAVFTVTRVSQHAKSRFPTEAVYGAIDHAGLRLITCGGTYDASRHRYLDNVVVFAKLSSVRGART